MAFDRVLIGGMPRSGTTLLMAIFYDLGFDIGYTKDEVDNAMQGNYGALEFYRDNRRGNPEVIKHPTDWDHIEGNVVMKTEALGWTFSHVIVCTRDPNKVLKSQRRRRPSWKKNTPDAKLIRQLERGLGRIIISSHGSSVDPILLEFPRYISDMSYLAEKVSPAVCTGKIEDIMSCALNRINKSLVHV